MCGTGKITYSIYKFYMAEFLAYYDMRAHAPESRRIINQIFPEIRSFFFLETSDTSALTISVYDKKEAADPALEQRNNCQLEKNPLMNFTMKA